MSMNEENFVEQEDIDLDTFSDALFGQKVSTPEPASSEDEVEDSDPESDAPIDNEVDTQGDDTPEDEDEDETEEVEEETPKPKKTRFQERIDELNGKYREEQRQREALEARLAQLEQQTPKPETQAQEVVDDGPDPNALNADGSDKYPLGEFDPNYIRDLTRFTLEQERQEFLKREAEETEKIELEEQRTQLQTEWNSKLEPARERYPDFQDKGQQLVDSFSGLDEAYSEYLTTTLMSMDYGPDVLYYLANHPDEARSIVNSGAAKATVALGRLEAKFAFADEEKQKARPRVSQAPTPPPVNKGSAVATTEVPDDTDDLDAFANKLFKKRK